VLVLVQLATLDGLGVPGDVEAAPAAQAACSPRPRVQINTTNTGADTLNVTVSVSPTTSGPTNLIQRINFGAARNAVIDVPGGPSGSAGNFTQTFGGTTTQATFSVRRQGGAMTVPFTVVDVCGDWPTFVGGGSAVGVPVLTPTPTPPGYPASGTRLYAPAVDTPHLAVIDTATNQLVTTIKYTDEAIVPGPTLDRFRVWETEGLPPRHVIVHPNGRQVFVLYTVPSVGPSLAVIDTAQNVVVARYRFAGSDCEAPFGRMLFNPDRTRLLILCSRWLVLDITQPSTAQVLPVPDQSLIPVFHPTSGHLLVPTPSGVDDWDIIGMHPVNSVNLGGGGVVELDAARNRLYSSSRLWVLDATTLSPIAIGTGGQLDPSGGSGRLALTADGSRIVEAFGSCPPVQPCSGRIAAFDTTTGALVASRTPLMIPLDLVAHPSQQRAYVTDETAPAHGDPGLPEVIGLNITDNTSHVTGLSRRGVLGFSTDGSRVYVMVDLGYEIYDATTLSLLGTVAFQDSSNRYLTPVSTETDSSGSRIYVAVRDWPDGATATGGVFVIDATTSQPITFLPIFDVRGIALLP
jgi:hypothetical protein